MRMIQLTDEIETVARRVAAAERASVEDTIRRALEDRARVHGLPAGLTTRRRMSAQDMLETGAEIAALPLRDHRSPQDIMDDLNGP